MKYDALKNLKKPKSASKVASECIRYFNHRCEKKQEVSENYYAIAMAVQLDSSLPEGKQFNISDLFEKACSLDKFNYDYRRDFCRYYLEQAENEKALGQFEQAAAIQSTVEIAREKAICLEKSGKIRRPNSS